MQLWMSIFIKKTIIQKLIFSFIFERKKRERANEKLKLYSILL